MSRAKDEDVSPERYRAWAADRAARATSDELRDEAAREQEIADFYAEGPTFALRFGARLEQDLTYTIGWLVFGIGLLAVGIASRSRGARLAALALVAVTACKGFLYDLSRLGGLYRVASFVGLAFALALVSLALQKFVLGSREPT